MIKNILVGDSSKAMEAAEAGANRMAAVLIKQLNIDPNMQVKCLGPKCDKLHSAHYLLTAAIYSTAEHFFELGFQNGAEAVGKMVGIKTEKATEAEKALAERMIGGETVQ